MKILENRVTIEDFIFAKEVRMGTYRFDRSQSFTSSFLFNAATRDHLHRV
jgi:hypothetical protein